MLDECAVTAHDVHADISNLYDNINSHVTRLSGTIEGLAYPFC